MLNVFFIKNRYTSMISFCNSNRVQLHRDGISILINISRVWPFTGRYFKLCQWDFKSQAEHYEWTNFKTNRKKKLNYGFLVFTRKVYHKKGSKCKDTKCSMKELTKQIKSKPKQSTIIFFNPRDKCYQRINHKCALIFDLIYFTMISIEIYHDKDLTSSLKFDWTFEMH